MRLGEVNKLVNTAALQQNPYRPSRNFTCDATVDEFHFFRQWDNSTETVATNFWGQGRYHLPRGATEGRYTSPRFGLAGRGVGRMPPPPSQTAAADEGLVAAAGPGMTTVAGRALAMPRLLGVSWTWFGELNDRNPPFLPLLVDYGAANAGNPSYLKPILEVTVQVDKAWSMPVTEEGYSPITDLRGAPLDVEDSTNLRWSAQFRWASSIPVGAILLATPYLDDLTLYFDTGDSGFVNYYFN